MVTRASSIDDRSAPTDVVLSPEAQAIDIVEGLQYGTLSHKEAAARLGVSTVQAQQYHRELKSELTEKARERLENSIRKQARIYGLKEGAKRVAKGERIERVAKDLGTTTRTLYRYLDVV